MNGADVLLLVNVAVPEAAADFIIVGSQRDVTFDESTEEIDVSSKDKRTRRVIPGRYSATVSLDSLYVPSCLAYGALRDAMRAGELVQIQRQEYKAGVVEYVEYADAVITGLSSGMPDQGEATVSVDLTIDDEWSVECS